MRKRPHGHVFETSLKMPRRSFWAMLPALLSACSAVDLLNATVPTDTYRRTDGLSYGAHPRQRLDIYQPLPSALSTAQAAPMVVFFYGGTWSSGNRKDYRFVGEALASRGMVVIVADYRLSPEFRYPVFLQDSAAAVRWAVEHAAEWGADPTRIFIMGHSAGAYNAAMLALDARWLTAEGLSPARLAGWIGVAGPYDFLPIGDRQTQVAFDWPSTPADSQPMAHVSAHAPRTLLLAPENDHLVDTQRSTVTLARRLKEKGVQVESALFEGVSHMTVIATLAAVMRGRAPVLERVTAFVKAAA